MWFICFHILKDIRRIMYRKKKKMASLQKNGLQLAKRKIKIEFNFNNPKEEEFASNLFWNLIYDKNNDRLCKCRLNLIQSLAKKHLWECLSQMHVGKKATLKRFAATHRYERCWWRKILHVKLKTVYKWLKNRKYVFYLCCIEGQKKPLAIGSTV